MALKAGSLSLQSLSNSMAQAMENAFIQQWPVVMVDREPPKPEELQQMQLMFVAIAQGVISHLMEHPKSFKVEVTLPSGFNETTASGTVTEIKVDTNNFGELE
jgi:hypothetical protein